VWVIECRKKRKAGVQKLLPFSDEELASIADNRAEESESVVIAVGTSSTENPQIPQRPCVWSRDRRRCSSSSVRLPSRTTMRSPGIDSVVRASRRHHRRCQRVTSAATGRCSDRHSGYPPSRRRARRPRFVSRRTASSAITQYGPRQYATTSMLFGKFRRVRAS
jgi:hypothetical protein